MQQKSLAGMGQKGKYAKSTLSAFHPLNAVRGRRSVPLAPSTERE
jgi:hypothetical protein